MESAVDQDRQDDVGRAVFDATQQYHEAYARLHDQVAAGEEATQRFMDWVVTQYRQCIVSARACNDGGHYEKCNGRAEAYRQAAEYLAGLTGARCPDWDQIRRDVPADGVFRA